MGDETGRKSNGQFGPGNPGGGGPRGSRGAHWNKLVHDNTTDEEFLAIWTLIKTAAAAGDSDAIETFLARLLGKPVQAVEMSGAEGGPQRISFTFEGKPDA